MKVALGLYTTLYSAPSSLFDRTLSLVYEPIFSYLYNNGGNHIFLYQSSQMMKYIKRERAEYKTLLGMLMKRGEIEPITGSWSESVLSLLPPKDRAGQIEKFTSEIKHEYSILPQSAFFYGGVWHPNYVSLLNNAGIDSVVISTHDGKEQGETEPFVMNELGRRVKIYPTSDEADRAVMSYSRGEIDYDELRSTLLRLIHSDNESLVLFINIDALVLGAVREGNGHKPGLILSDILDRVQTVPLSSLNVSKMGYLPQGWYGRESNTYGMRSLNSLFIKNAQMRYLYNRYITIAENQSLRNNRFLKKDVTTALFNTSVGNLFIYDAEMSPLRSTAHSSFWRAVIDAENCYTRYLDGPSMREYDYEEISSPSVVMSNKTYLCVISPLGGGSSEFDYLPGGINFFSVRPDYDPENPSSPLRKSFTDIVTIGKESYSTENSLFSIEVLDKKRSEVVLTPLENKMPFVISKRYKLKANTFTLDSTIMADGRNRLEGIYSISIYLSLVDAELVLPEQRMDMVAKGCVEAKTVKYGSKESDALITLSSTKQFTLTEESGTISEETALGMEEFVLYKKITFTFPLEVDGEESVTYRLNIK